MTKSLPGRILRKLQRAFVAAGRTEFTKKELRLDPELKLPPVRDNLDTRLILLRQRLEERFPFVRLEATERDASSSPWTLASSSVSCPARSLAES